MNQIKLTLQSDMCAASGTGYSHTIDTDVCYDEYGLPLIPARRLKGCLREAARYINMDWDRISAIFGESGTKEGALKISNGLLEDYKNLIEDIRQNLPDVTQQEILGLFTSSRISTKINPVTGVAEQETMRVTRVVNRKLPYRGNDTVFIFECECDLQYRDDMASICKALRHMGSDRNRGMGVVKCEYITAIPENGHSNKPEREFGRSGNISAKAVGNGMSRIDLLLYLLDPVLLPAASNDRCSSYISGTSVLGALAAAYLRDGKTPDLTFEKLFLRGDVIYSNFYISDQKGTISFPAPSCIGKIKASNGIDDGKITSRFHFTEAKVLRDGFATAGLKEIKVRIEDIFHHVHGDKLLYTQEAVSAGQYFRGSVTGPDDLIEVILNLLNQYPLRIGRSKTAQYARARVEGLPEQDQTAPAENTISPGDLFAVSLASDVLITDENGVDITNPATLREMVMKAYGLTNETVESFSDIDNLSVRLVHGYNAKRNLRNVPRSVFAMGSTFGFRARQNILIDKERSVIGERQAEGFGCLQFISEKEVIRLLENDAFNQKDEPGSSRPDDNSFTLLSKAWSMQKENSIAKKAREIFAQESCRKFVNSEDISLSFIGRAMLMTEQATDTADLEKRIDSIKDDRKKKLLEKLFNSIRNQSEWRDVFIYTLRLCRYYRKQKDTDNISKGGEVNG